MGARPDVVPDAAPQDSPHTPARAEPVVELSALRHRWARGAPVVLEVGQLSVGAGERVFIAGPSGSGKTTLLGLISGIARPSEGSVRVLGERLETLSGQRRDRFRADHIGVIFQLFNLVPYLSVLDNVLLPLRFSPRRRRAAQAAAQGSGRPALEREVTRLLAALDMHAPELLQAPVSRLSVGQQQRVAAARALLGAPELVLADEPTSALDSDRREAFLSLLFNEIARTGATLLFVSHERALAERFERVIDLPERASAGR